MHAAQEYMDSAGEGGAMLVALGTVAQLGEPTPLFCNASWEHTCA